MNTTLELQELCNKYGDFKVCYYLKEQDSFTKHYSVMECWHDLDNLKWRLEKATDRTLFQSELVLDIDPEKNDSRLKTIKRLIRIIKFLKREQIPFKAYNTGGKGFHVHCIIMEFYFIQKESQRNNIRMEFIELFDCDKMKASEKMMILMPGKPNRKTGIKKFEVML